MEGVEVIELNVRIDHVHIVCSKPPKVSVSELLVTLKGKLAIKIFKTYPKLKQNPYWGNHFWSRGYFITTVGVDEDIITRYVKYQEGEDKKEETQTRDFDLFFPPSGLEEGFVRCISTHLLRRWLLSIDMYVEF